MSNIAIIGQNSVEYINILLDVWSNGDCAVLLDWQTPLPFAMKMLEEASVDTCYIDKKLLQQNIELCQESIKLIVFDGKTKGPVCLPLELYQKFRSNYSKDDAVVIYSSGTTGKAKGIVLSHYAINMNADAIIDYMRPTKEDCLYIAKSLTHSSTITGELLVALKTGMKLIIAPTVVPPRFVLGNVVNHNVSILCLNPTLLSLYAEEIQRKRYDLSTLKRIYVSGSILNDKVYTLAHNAFSDVEIYNVYGLSEAAPRVTAQRKDCAKGNSVGKPIAGVEVEVIDSQGNPLGTREYGIVHVSSPGRYSRYISGEEKFVSLYKDWLNTGDVGYWDENGELRIVNRVDDLIILDSHKIYPHEVEERILQTTDVHECVVSKLEIEGKVVVGCLYVHSSNIEKDIRSSLQSVLLPYEMPHMFVRCDALPRTANGKISKTKVCSVLQEVLTQNK